MKTEKIVISFIALIIGIIFAGLAFYFYQSSKIIPASDTKRVILTSPPKEKDKPESDIFLTLDSPGDEEVISKKTVTISGKTLPDAIIIISTLKNDQVITPAANGNFSTTATLEDGENIIEIMAVDSNGLETKVSRMVTFSNESF